MAQSHVCGGVTIGKNELVVQLKYVLFRIERPGLVLVHN